MFYKNILLLKRKFIVKSLLVFTVPLCHHFMEAWEVCRWQIEIYAI